MGEEFKVGQEFKESREELEAMVWEEYKVCAYVNWMLYDLQ